MYFLLDKINIFKIYRKKVLTNVLFSVIIIFVVDQTIKKEQNGSLAQLGERLPYKQDVTGSSPVTPTIKYGPVVQLVRTLACHARGRGFEAHAGRHIFLFKCLCRSVGRAKD